MHTFFKPLVFALIVSPLSIDAFADSWIDEINEASDSYKLIKSNKSEAPVTIFKTLESGDCIQVIGTKAKLWIASDSGPRQMLSHDEVSNKCITENDIGHVPTEQSNLIEWAGRWLTNRVSSQTARSVVSAAARGNEPKGITIPLANHGGLRMVAGKRPVYFAWQGGKQPFSVRMVPEGGQRVIFEYRNVTHRWVKIDPLSLSEGTYRIEIGDAVGMTAQNLHIVSSAEIPSHMLEIHGNKGSQDRVDLVEAVMLASQGKGWAFEAYQVAAKLALRYQPAQILQESLERGDMPKSIPE